MAYCDALSLSGRDDWHLATNSELRSLIRGCPATETGGSCGVGDSCLGCACWNDACDGCGYLGGPGADGVYWPPELGSAVAGDWSSSPTWSAFYAWYVCFCNGYVGNGDKTSAGDVRCVRPGP